MAFEFAVRSFFSPQDDVATALIAQVSQAQQRIRMIIYGYTLTALTDALLAAHARGVDVAGIFDLSQSGGKAEQVEVARLVAAGIPCTVGTSPKAGAIVHEKGIAVDGQHVIQGSYNFSASAANQVNHCDFYTSAERVAWFEANWDTLHAWMVQHKLADPAWQGPPPMPPASPSSG